jgi:hypothetical protein
MSDLRVNQDLLGEHLLALSQLFSSEMFRVPVEPGLVFPAPITHRFEHWCERHAVRRNGIADVRRNTPSVMPQKDSIRYHFVQMADQHPLRYLWYASPQFAGAHGPIEQSP